MEYQLAEHERALLREWVARGSPSEARRAQIVLLSAKEATVRTIAEAVGLSTVQVNRWRRAWRERGLAIFPEPLPPQDADQPEPVPGVDVPRLPLILAERVGMLPEDPLAEAARKVLHFHFERMLLHEPTARLGEDIEGVHDMRVATRRMRSALRLFGPFFKRRAIAPLIDGLRTAGRVLGTVRDLDVFMHKAQQFMAAHPDVDLGPLIEGWQVQLDDARRALIAYLDSAKFGQFVERFQTFVNTPGQGALPLPEPGEAAAFQVRHIAPRLIYEHYERVRAYETILEGAPLDTLHALRIEFKRFRYALEFFEEVLGPEAQVVIKAVKGMQDHLGDLNDTRVAIDVLSAFVQAQQTAFSGIPVFMRPSLAGVHVYCAAQREEQARLLATFPEAWAQFTAEDNRRSLALAVAVL